MKNVFWLTWNILKINLRKKSTIITFFILPIFGILLSIAVYAKMGSGTSNIGVIDHDQSALSKGIINSLQHGPNFKIIATNEREFKRQIVAGTMDCVLIIPLNMANSLMNQQVPEIKIVSLKGAAATAWVKNYVNMAMQNLFDMAEAAGGRETIFNRIYRQYQQETVPIRVINIVDRGRNKGMTFQSIGFLIMFMLMGAGNCVEMILKEKRNHTYYRICAAPVSARTYILGNILANLAIIAIQVGLMIGVMTKVFGIQTYIPFWQLFVVLVVFGLTAIGLGLIIIAFAKSTQQAGILQTLIVTPTCFMAGCFWPIELVPRELRRVADFMPQRWAIAAVQKLQEGNSFGQITLHLEIILAFALAFFLIAAYRFSRDENIKTFI